MGTVGISFGSPTSGTGFDVTSTVNQIVANLRNVETPWKTQLTSLQAQDTAMTSIGTDLGTLSTAMQSLTDFQGVLAGKQGSSSDNNVLELTSAATTAVAGSHTIVVSNLAQTSSYYSNPITNADDTLSGTLTLAVGSGSPQTITLDPTDNTLATLANAINTGNYGVAANVITDSSGSRLSLVSSTSGAGGNITLSSTLADASNGNAALSFTQAQPGQDAQMKVDGAPISSASNTVTNAIQGVTFQLLNSSTENIQVQITNDNSAVETALNTFVTAYNAVTKDVNTQEGNDSSGNPEPLFGNPVIATIQQQLQDALTFTQPAQVVASTSAIQTTDTLSGSLSIQVGTGSSNTVNVPSGPNNTLAGLASAINAANIGVTANVITAGNSVTLGLENATGGAAGVITVNSGSLQDATSGQPVLFGPAHTNGITSLTQLGISVNNDGTLTLNSDTLDSALNSNYADVVNFFQPSATFTSFGGSFTNAMNNLGNSAPDGALYLSLQQDSTEEAQLNTNISNEELSITAQQAALTTELNQANYTLTEIPQQLNEVNELYSAMTGYNENPNG